MSKTDMIGYVSWWGDRIKPRYKVMHNESSETRNAPESRDTNTQNDTANTDNRSQSVRNADPVQYDSW